jgi:hypothetical protein
MRAILDSDPRRYVVPLLLLAALASALGPVGDLQPIWGPTVTVVLAFLRVPIVWLMSYPLAWAGHLFGGTGDAVAVRAAIAWAGAPAIFAAIIRMALLATLGADAAEEGFVVRAVDRFLDLADLWVVLLGLVTLAEAHRFSVLRALATSLLGSVVFVLPVVLVVVVLTMAGLSERVGLVN